VVSTIRTEHWAWCAIEFGTLPRTLRAPRMPLLPSGQVGGTNRLRLIGGDDVQLGAASLRKLDGRLDSTQRGRRIVRANEQVLEHLTSHPQAVEPLFRNRVVLYASLICEPRVPGTLQGDRLNRARRAPPKGRPGDSRAGPERFPARQLSQASRHPCNW
jgi:hypothetical protein